MIDRPMVSYAQNLEDVILNRVFQDRAEGFYVDVGAHHPEEFSVTKYFYELGWRGVNIEPIKDSCELIAENRPRDITLNVACGDQHGFLTIFSLEGYPEYASLEERIVIAAGQSQHARVLTQKVEVFTLAEICEQYCRDHIDFLKIDVEGWERQVLAGADWNRFRPTILVIEATEPRAAYVSNWDEPEANTTWREWEEILTKARYFFTYFDGLNRYYLREEDQHLATRFSIPINRIQDDFVFSSEVQTQEFKDQEIGRLTKRLEKVEVERALLREELKALGRRFENLILEQARTEEKLHLRLKEITTQAAADAAENDKEIRDLRKRLEQMEHEKDRLAREQELVVAGFEKEVKSLSTQLETEQACTARERERHVATSMELEASQNQVTVLEEAKSTLVHRLNYLSRKLEAADGEKQAADKDLSALEYALLSKSRDVEFLVQQREEKDAFWAEELAGFERTLATVRATLNEERSLAARRTRFRPTLVQGFSKVMGWWVKAGLPEPEEESAASAAAPETSIPLNPAATCSVDDDILLWHDDPFAEPQWETFARELGQFATQRGANLRIVANLEASLAEGISLTTPWIGFSHVPLNMPGWLQEQGRWRRLLGGSPFSLPQWQTNRAHCRGLFVFCSDHAEALQNLIGMPVTVLRYPLPTADATWSQEAFISSGKRQIVQFGVGTQRRHAIYLVPDGPYGRLLLQPSGDMNGAILLAEERHLNERRLFHDTMRDGVSIATLTDDDALEPIFASNLLLIHYYGLCTPSLLQTGVAQHTPMLVNPLPAVVEYLGEDYPLYFSFYQEAADKATDLDLVVSAHDYLAGMCGEESSDPETLWNSLWESLEQGDSVL